MGSRKFPMRRSWILWFFFVTLCAAQAVHVHGMSDSGSVPLQPLAQQVRRLEDALNYLGQPLPDKTRDAINTAIATNQEQTAVREIQRALDPFVIATVSINAESRVKVERGPAEAALIQGGSRFFLVKVINSANVT